MAKELKMSLNLTDAETRFVRKEARRLQSEIHGLRDFRGTRPPLSGIPAARARDLRVLARSFVEAEPEVWAS